VDDVAGADPLTIDDQRSVLGDVLRDALESVPGQRHAHVPTERDRELAPVVQDPAARRRCPHAQLGAQPVQQLVAQPAQTSSARRLT